MKRKYIIPASEALELAPASRCLVETSVQGKGNSADMPIVDGPGNLFGSPYAF
ncbi:MAG: hypothetical protein IJ623_06030 [Bacteroidales bacterium]|nr:hypothetical protein [Bacteroidales bacterium]